MIEPIKMEKEKPEVMPTLKNACIGIHSFGRDIVVSGEVYDREGFVDGTVVTTSPVRMIYWIPEGMVVKTKNTEYFIDGDLVEYESRDTSN